jgi:hypothetical protein
VTREPGAWPGGWTAAALYGVAAIAFVWPLPRHIFDELPWDLGDPLLNVWILGWVSERLLDLLRGDAAGFLRFWNANIFYPEPLTLAYSEHLTAQAIQTLPVYAATGNLVLCYNLLFLSTFVLSGVGMYLLVRQLTGHAAAGFVAGMVYAFAPYRVPQFSHHQVLSSQWLPLALYGIARWAATARPRPLAGASAALVAQNLSCGYYAVYFAPFWPVFLVQQMAAHGRLRSARAWAAAAAAAAVVALATLPFLLPYQQLRSAGDRPRPLSEVARFSADVRAYGTAHPAVHLWGEVADAYLKPEGELFPGLVAPLLALVGVAAFFPRGVRGAPPKVPRSRRVAIAAGAIVAAVQAAAIAVILIAGATTVWIGPLRLSVSRLGRAVALLAVGAVTVLAASPRARRWLRDATTDPRGTLLVVTMLMAAVVFSWGPTIRLAGRAIGDGPYALLYEHVPGFDGLRVPARYWMVGLVFLGVLAGYGAQRCLRAFPRRTLVAILALAVLADGAAMPIPLNDVGRAASVATPARDIGLGPRAPDLIRDLARLPGGSVLVHFPFGALPDEIRYTAWSTVHWLPIVNGYSGKFPASYKRRGAALIRPLANPDVAWRVLVESGATHAVVHREAFAEPSDAQAVVDWLTGRGANVERERSEGWILRVPTAGTAPPSRAAPPRPGTTG